MEDIRKEANQKLDPNVIGSILKKTEELPWLRVQINEYVELLNFCISSAERELINDLLSNFTLLNLTTLNNALVYIKNELIRNYNILPSDTMFYAFSDDKKADGSQFVLQIFKNVFNSYEGWNEHNFCNSLLAINDHSSKHKNIILVDDFIGTGNTAFSKYYYVKNKIIEKKLSNMKIIITAVAAMSFSKKRFLDEGIQVISPHWLKKGISERYPDDKKAEILDIMLKIESRLDKRRGKKYFPFGYEQSEALFSIETLNIPNNVFPVFWWPYSIDGRRITLFRGLR